MKIEKIVGEHGVLPQLCRNGACPAAIVAADGDVFIQGYQPSSAQSAELSAPPGEGFVRMSRATFEKIARQLLDA